MKVSADHDYAFEAEQVYRLFTDAKEIEAKQAALGARDITVVTCRRTKGGASVKFKRKMPAEVPGVLKQFLQPWNRVEQTEKWRRKDDGDFMADVTVDIDNVPVSVKGRLHIEAFDDGCINHVRFEIKCGIPLVGRVLAEFVANDCRRVIAAEYDYISERLEDS